jgi:hypothetical protein
VECTQQGPARFGIVDRPATEGEDAMAYAVLHFETDDYESWKSMFDSDPAGRRQAGIGHVVSRSADNPNEVFVRVEFASVDDAKAFRERLVGSGVLDNPGMRVKMGPTVIEPVENVTY